MLTDNEIKEVTEDALRFKALAETLEEIICTSKTPITIGVYGKWGSGKTSLMRITENLLKDKDTIKTVWFDAWRFDKIHDLRVALIDTVLSKMQEDRDATEEFKDRVGDLLKRVNWFGLGKIILSHFLILPPPVPQVMDSLAESFKGLDDKPGETLKLIRDFEYKFRGFTKEYVGDEGRLVVLIDDLDRCIPKKAVDVLEAIKLFLNVERSVFIIGVDKKVIEDGIIQKYGEKSESWGRNYLDKIIQVPFNLPPLRKDIITERFILGLDISDEIKQYAPIIAEAGDNPRMVKRLLNQFEIQRILATKRNLMLDSGILAKLIVLEFRWFSFYADFISVYSETQTNLILILQEISRSGEAERKKRLEDWMTLKKYFDDERLMSFLLGEDPLLADVNLDHYVYMIRSTWELRKSAENYFNIAYSFAEERNYSKAIENYEKVIELDPENGKAWNNKGFALASLGKHEEGIRCYDIAIRLNSENEQAWGNKAKALYDLGKYEEALDCCNKATELNPKECWAWYNKSVALIYMEKYEEALKCYEKTIELNPEDEEAWNSKGFVLAKLRRYEEALKCYEKTIELNPEDEEAWNSKGFVLAKLRRYEEAIECYSKTVDLNPTFENAFQKGIEIAKLGEFEEATQFYDRAIELNPENEKAWYHKGFALSELRRYKDAIVCYDRAIELNPNFEKAWYQKGIVFSTLKRYKEAIKSYNEAIKLNSKNENAWYSKGVALGELNQYKDAIDCYDKAAKLNPKFDVALRAKTSFLEKIGQKLKKSL